ncbi:MAG: hypothetical protein IPK20_02470 [Betaproteobacteria bacterium]|nr:hypothetical protein [Betaproteobacteria bacterium]
MSEGIAVRSRTGDGKQRGTDETGYPIEPANAASASFQRKPWGFRRDRVH